MRLTGANIARDNIVTNDPSVYNFANWALCGIPDMFLGAVNPEETFSFDHWMNSLGTAALLMPAVNAASKALSKPTIIPQPTNWGMWCDLEIIQRNGGEYARINGRLFTRESIERMTPAGYGSATRNQWNNPSAWYSSRGITPSVVEDVINNGLSNEVIRNGTTRVIYKSNGIQVITEQAGKIVVTTYPY